MSRLDRLAFDLRLTGRAISAQPPGAVLLVATLAVLIGTATACFSLYHGARYRAHDVAEIDRLLIVEHVAPVVLREIRSKLTSVTSVGIVVGGTWTASSEEIIKATGKPDEVYSRTEQFSGGFAKRGWLETVRPTLVLGRGFSPADYVDKPPAVIISHRLWQDRFGGAADIIGSEFKVNARSKKLEHRPVKPEALVSRGKDSSDTSVPMLIVGVMSPGFVYPAHHDRPTDLWIPMADGAMAELDTAAFSNAAARLGPGVSKEQAAEEILRLASSAKARHPDVWADQDPTTVSGFGADVFAFEVDVLFQNLTAALALLLVGCASAGGHLLGRTLRRRREHALSLALGASPGRLVGHIVLAASAFALTAGLLGRPVAAGLITLLKRHHVAARPIPGFLAAGFNSPTLIFAGLATVLVAALIAWPSALVVTRADLYTNLKQAAATHSGSRGARNLRELLLALQVALAVLLLVSSFSKAAACAGFLARKGFNDDDVFYLQANLRGPQVTAKQEAMRSKLLGWLSRLPGTFGAGLAAPEPYAHDLEGPGWVKVDVEAPTSGKVVARPEVSTFTIGGQLLRTLRIPVLRGRAMSPDETGAAAREVLVDWTFAGSVLGGRDPLGHQIRLSDGRVLTIVGVVGNVRYGPGSGAPLPAIYLPHQGSKMDSATFLVWSNSHPEGLLAQLRRGVREVAPELTDASIGRYRALTSPAMLPLVAQASLTAGFGLIALLLALIGLHATATALAVARTNEIGVRVAIGASPSSILALVLRQGAGPIAAGLVIGAAGMTIGVRSVRFREVMFQGEPIDVPWAVAAVVVVILTTVVALLVPALRASQMSPSSALRNE